VGGDAQAGQLGSADASVDQEQDDGGIPTSLEGLAGAHGDQPAEAVLGDNRDGLLGDAGRLDLGHGILDDLVFLLEPFLADLDLGERLLGPSRRRC
jgi:hypothetical protein